MESKNLLSTILSDFFSKSESFLFLSLNQPLVTYISTIIPENTVVVDLDNFEMQKIPLSPFPYLVKELKIDEELIEKYSYFLHKETILSYFKDGFCKERIDIIVPEEIEYEKAKLDNESIDDIFAEVEDIDDIPIISIDSKEREE